MHLINPDELTQGRLMRVGDKALFITNASLPYDIFKLMAESLTKLSSMKSYFGRNWRLASVDEIQACGRELSDLVKPFLQDDVWVSDRLVLQRVGALNIPKAYNIITAVPANGRLVKNHGARYRGLFFSDLRKEEIVSDSFPFLLSSPEAKSSQ